MLPVHLKITKEAKQQINQNLGYMFDFLEAICEGLSYEEVLDCIFPQYLLEEDIEKCISTVKDLYTMTQDNYTRDYLSPFHEWTLYHIILWWIDVADDIDLDVIPREYCICSDGTDMYNTLNDIERYLDFLFEDWDFLDVDKIYEIYKKEPEMVENLLHIDISQYIELMPKDIREEYRKLSQTESKNDKIEENQEQYIVRSIYTYLMLESDRALKYEDCEETDLSDSIRNGLFQLFQEHGIAIDRENRCGYAISNLGELDFYIYSFEDGVYKKLAIGENKKWGEYENSIRQLLGYMDCKTQFGFTIIYNKDTQLKTVLEGRKKILNQFNIDGEFRIIGHVEKVEGLTDVLKTCHENPEKPGTYFYLYHFIFNVYRPHRKKAAIMGRKRAKKRENSCSCN